MTFLLAQSFVTTFFQTVWQITLVLAPFAIFAVFVHFLEQVVQRRLSMRFGWNSVLWTGWLGTPIHELSHATLCYVFGHRIHEMALFQPDLETGRLGYVRHSFVRGNWYQEIGTVFIGLAPLMGGTIVLVALMWLFYPGITGVFQGDNGSETLTGISYYWSVCRETFAQVLTWRNLLTWQFWLFMYLVLCVASHMAPSSSDYQAATRGAIIVGAFLVLAALLLALMPATATSILNASKQWMAPIVSLLCLAATLCSVAAIGVTLFTVVWDWAHG